MEGFRATNQRKETRREFDLNDPEYLKKSTNTWLVGWLVGPPCMIHHSEFESKILNRSPMNQY